MKRIARGAVVLCGAMLAVALAAALLDLPAAPIRLDKFVAANLPRSGVDHPVTAVLLNFRAYDTLLEVAVLLLASLVVLAVAPEGKDTGDSFESEPVLQVAAPLAVPLMVLVALYLLWAGSHRPGGAFQAAAVLAAAAVLLNLAGVLRGWGPPRFRLRAGLTGGFLMFLAVATALLAEGGLLRYPPEAAGLLILAIEAGLTLSLALTLAGLFLFLSGDKT